MSASPARLRGMLRELHITGLGVIDDLDLEFHPGPERADGRDRRRQDHGHRGPRARPRRAGRRPRSCAPAPTAARVQARFDAGPAAGEWAEDGEVVLARTVPAEGRGSRADRRADRHGVGARGARRATWWRCTASTRRSGCSRPPRRPRSATGSPATRTSWRSPPTARRSTGCGRRARSSRCSPRPRATANASSTCSRTRCARSRASAPVPGEREPAPGARRAGSHTSSGSSRAPDEALGALAGDDGLADAAAAGGRGPARCGRAWTRRRATWPTGPRRSRPTPRSSPATCAPTARRSQADPARLDEIRDADPRARGPGEEVRRHRGGGAGLPRRRRRRGWQSLAGADDRRAALERRGRGARPRRPPIGRRS